MTERKRIQIPYNAAGRLAFDVFRSIAEKMLTVGNEATGNFILANFPGRKTIYKDYNNGQLRRVIKLDGGEHAIIIYDYETEGITSALLVKSPANDKYLAGEQNIRTENLDLYY